MKKGLLAIMLLGVIFVGCNNTPKQEETKEPEKVEETVEKETDTKEMDAKTEEMNEKTKKKAIKFDTTDVAKNLKEYIENKQELYIEGKITLIKINSVVSTLIVDYNGTGFTIDLVMVNDAYKELEKGDMVRVYGTIDDSGVGIKLNSTLVEKID